MILSNEEELYFMYTLVRDSDMERWYVCMGVVPTRLMGVLYLVGHSRASPNQAVTTIAGLARYARTDLVLHIYYVSLEPTECTFSLPPPINKPFFLFFKNSLRAFGPMWEHGTPPRNFGRIQGDGSVNCPGPRCMYME